MGLQTIGMPEVQINLSHVASYLALAPKSNTSYVAIKRANKSIEDGVLYAVPNHLKDSHYKGAAALGHGEGYIYTHNEPDRSASQNYLPEKHIFYE